MLKRKQRVREKKKVGREEGEERREKREGRWRGWCACGGAAGGPGISRAWDERGWWRESERPGPCEDRAGQREGVGERRWDAFGARCKSMRYP